MASMRNRHPNPVLPASTALRLHPLYAGIRSGLLGMGIGMMAATPAWSADLPVVLRDQTGKVVRFEGANLPGVPYANAYGGRTIDINQFDERATLHWESFDIGADNEVRFNQPSSSSIALNRVLGEANVKSIINGRLTANGRVYIINQNGILFDRNAEINTQSLIASTLDIDDRIYKEVGIEKAIKEPTAQPAFDSFGKPMGEIVCEEGCRITSGKNGRVMLLAPSVTNKGEIRSEEGQIILAAAEDKVFLTETSKGSPIRGLIVEVNTGGDVSNLGSLISERGNVSMIGMAVNQNGLARATTSVSLNGSIRLVAQDMGGAASVLGDANSTRTLVVQRTGELNLGEGSVTEVIPSADAGVMAPDAQDQPLSTIDLGGKKVTLKKNSTVRATGGNIDVTAVADPLNNSIGAPGNPDISPAVITLEEGAVLDVSGTDDTTVSVGRNIVVAEARGNELADSPLQQDGPIRDKKLLVDVRKGTRFLNIEGAASSIERDVGERLSTGGTISLQSEGSIVVSRGSSVDISGGQVNYTGDTVVTSKLVRADGKVVDIADADPNHLYVGVLGDYTVEHEKWGVTEEFLSTYGRYEPGYIEGKDAGTLSLKASRILFEGELLADAVSGRWQRRKPVELSIDALDVPSFARPYDQIPYGGLLEYNLTDSRHPDLIIGENDGTAYTDGTSFDIDADPVIIAPELLSGSGVSRLTINNFGRVILNRSVELPAFGSADLTGLQVLVPSELTIPGGSVSLVASNDLGQAGFDFSSLVRVDGRVDVSGRWVNDSPLVNPEYPTAPIVKDGGSIAISSLRDVVLGGNGLLDVSGGAYLADGELMGGNGGDISLRSWSSSDDRFTSRLLVEGELRGFGMGRGGRLSVNAEEIRVEPFGNALDANYVLDGSKQFGMADNGLWNITTLNDDLFQLGGFSGYTLTSSRGGLDIADGARLELRNASRVVDPGGLREALQQYLAENGSLNLAGADGRHPASLVRGGTDIEQFTRTELLPEYQRGSVDLALNAGLEGPLVIGTGSAILGEPGARVRIRAQSGIQVDGLISAPAGRIELVNTGGQGSRGANSRIWLGPNADLRSEGVVRVDPVNNFGLRIGEVLDAGVISLRAEQGSIVGAPGASISVDGVSADLDIGLNGRYVNTRVSGDAGDIEFYVADSLLYAGSLSGAADAQGGRVSVTLDPTLLKLGSIPVNGSSVIPRGPHVAVFEDYTASLPGRNELIDEDLRGRAYVPVSQVTGGGFDSLAVTVRSSAEGSNSDGVTVPDTPESVSVIEFRNDLNLALARSIELDAAILRSVDDAQVSLRAPYIALGSSDRRTRIDGSVPDVTSDTNAANNNQVLNLTPLAGGGRLSASGDLIELVGELVTEGFGMAGSGNPGVSLVSTGDVRMRGVRVELSNDFKGVFRTAGDLYIEAQRIYPTTLTDFEVSVVGDGGRIELARPADRNSALPLSVAGRLELHADTIRQGGTLVAPLGELLLAADSELTLTAGSLTGTSAFGVSAPFFQTQPDGDLLLSGDSDSGNDVDYGEIIFVESIENPAYERLLPEQKLTLRGPRIDVQDGASFDLRGGGDIRSTEFEPGPGGSRDILLANLGTRDDPVANTSFAIMPGLGEFAPYDPQESPDFGSVQGFRTGDTIVLEEGMPGLPAGEYAILPARYALFGGYLVTPAADSRDLSPGRAATLLDGSRLLAGRYGTAGSDKVSSRSQGFVIEDGAGVRKRAAYKETPLVEQYAEGVLRRPVDAGTLVVDVEPLLDLNGNPASWLNLSGQLVAGGETGGRGSRVDIIADRIHIASNPGAGDGVQLLTAQLEGLGADSLLIGGQRSSSTDGTLITPVAERLTVASGVELALPELLLVADELDLESSSGAKTVLASNTAATGRTRKLILADDSAAGVNGDAAVLAVSGDTLLLERMAKADEVATGSLTIGSDATLRAAGSIVADVVGDADIAGTLDTGGGLISLGASTISLGDTEGRGLNDGLVLSNERIAGLANSRLRLRSSTMISLYGDLADPAGGDSIRFSELALDAKGLVGIDNAGHTVRLNADEIRVANTTGDRTGLAEAGLAPAAGGLEMNAERIVLGDGQFTVQGYSAVNARASGHVRIDGDGEFMAEAPLAIDTPILVAATGVSGTVTARNASLAVTGGDAAAPLPAESGLASSLTLQGDAVRFAGRAVLPSGTIKLRQLGDPDAPVAGNDLLIDEGAILDVAGVTLDFGPTQVGTPGGMIHLEAETGSVRVMGDALFDVSSSPLEGDAGKVLVEAPLGTVELAGETRFRSGGEGGEFHLDANRLAVGTVSTALAYTDLNRLLGDGFGDSRYVRLRNQAIELAETATVRSHEISAVSDNGDVIIRGTLDASGRSAVASRRDGGRILLAAGDSVEVESTAVLRATGAPDENGTPAVSTDGGLVELLALDTDGSDPLGQQDRVNLHDGALIDVRGGANATFQDGERIVTAPERRGGKLLVHTRRLDSNGDGQTDTLVAGILEADIVGAGQAQLVATHVVRDGDALAPGRIFDLDRETDGDGVFDTASITAADIAAINGEMGDFLAMAPDSVAGLDVAPGLVLESDGGLILEDEWDFHADFAFDFSGKGTLADEQFHFGQNASDPGVTGYLTLRAAGDVELAGNLTDGFYDVDLPFGDIFDVPDRLDSGYAAVDAEGNPVILPPTAWSYRIVSGGDVMSADPGAVRKGAGDLLLDTDVILRTSTGDIEVNAGGEITLEAGSAIYSAGYNRGISDNLKAVAGSGTFGAESLYNEYLGNGALFPVDGGDVRIAATGGITAMEAQASPSDWLSRVGEADATSTLGSDRGAIPTHWGIAFHRFTNGVGALGGGRLTVDTGGNLENVTLAIPTTGRTIEGAQYAGGKFLPGLETTEIAGGGHLRADIGGDMIGGSVLLGDGAADIRVGGDLARNSDAAGARIFVGGDTQFRLSAGGGLQIDAIQDPTTVPISLAQTGQLKKTGVDKVAYLDNLFYTFSERALVDVRGLSGDAALGGSGFVEALPPRLRVAAIQGDLVVDVPTFRQYPSPTGQLDLLAGHDLKGTGGTRLIQQDELPSSLPSIDRPDSLATLERATVPLHINDGNPNLFVARDGSITAVDGSFWSLRLAKSTVMSAGLDLRDLRVTVQNIREQDVSAFVAGRDIRQSAQRENDGRYLVRGADSELLPKYEISGPGTAQFIAGREISLGTSQGIESIGDTEKSILADRGADLLLMAGLGGELSYDRFIQTYLQDGKAVAGEGVVDYRGELIAFLARHGVAAGDDAVTVFRSLDRRLQRELLTGILFSELKASGIHAQTVDDQDYSRGFDAIAALFPQSNPDGGITMLLSQVQTLDGGDIDMLVPGGLINAGAANADIISKAADELGIVAAVDGDINVMVEDDFLVNSTRAFALQGDLLAWSSNGDIDAGRGAKTISSVPNPIPRLDENGQLVVEFPPAVQGSGLAGVNVYLFAPKGKINAGDAGIRATGNLTLGATEVLGADNIDVGGISIGVPVASAGLGASFVGASNVASSASSLADESTSSIGAAGEDSFADGAVGIVSVELIGFGE